MTMSSEETTQVDSGMGKYWRAGVWVTGLFVGVVLIGYAAIQNPYASVASVGIALGVLVVPYAVGRLSFWLWGLLR